MKVNIETFNAEWLQAWTDKDVERLLSFYTEDTVYKDPQTAAGLIGHSALRTYLTALFETTPPMTYTPEETWAINGGFCGRWYCQIGKNGEAGQIRGFDLVLLDGEKISHNEVYTHQL